MLTEGAEHRGAARQAEAVVDSGALSATEPGRSVAALRSVPNAAPLSGQAAIASGWSIDSLTGQPAARAVRRDAGPGRARIQFHGRFGIGDGLGDSTQ